MRPAGVPRSQYLRLQPLAARAFQCNGWLESFCFITLDMLQYRYHDTSPFTYITHGARVAR